MGLKIVGKSIVLFERFMGEIPKAANQTLLKYISGSETGWVFDGLFYDISTLADLVARDQESRHVAEFFWTPEVMFRGEIILADNLRIEDFIEGNIENFVSKIFKKVGGLLSPDELDVNSKGSRWVSRLPVDKSNYLVVEGDLTTVTIKLEPFSL